MASTPEVAAAEPEELQAEETATVEERICPVAEHALAEEFHNVGVEDEGDGDRGVSVLEGVGGFDDRGFAVRPYADDCTFYLKTGGCKFGLNCRFNHPVDRAGEEKENGKRREGSSVSTSHIKCKYYLSPGGCKFGTACRYNHPKEDTEIAQPNLNFLSLPLRPGEKECPFYMRSGSCAYGTNCRFHHPDPTTIEQSDSCNLRPNGEPPRVSHNSTGCSNGGNVPPRLLGSSPPTVVPSSYHMTINNAIPYFDTTSSYMPMMHSLLPPQGVLPNPHWNAYQASLHPRERIGYPHSAPAMNSLAKQVDASTNHFQRIQVEEFPQRPGQPECAHFLKTGYCKFKSACRYHHPKRPASNCPSGDVQNNSLPLRPGRKICWHYEKNGDCKYGSACSFDHPVIYGRNSATFGSMGMAVPGN